VTQDHEGPRVDLIGVPRGVAVSLVETLKGDADISHAKAAKLEKEGSPEIAQELRMLADEKHQYAECVKAQLRGERRVSHIHNSGAHTDQRHASGNSSITQVESSKLLPWLMLTCLLSGLSIALSIFAIIRSNDSMTLSLLLREDVRIFDHALTKHGINTDEHASEKGEE